MNLRMTLSIAGDMIRIHRMTQPDTQASMATPSNAG
jgi:hypothetical protein